MFEKKGLHQAAEILENDGIDNETDVSVLDQDYFCKLSSRGQKSLEPKKIERWCDPVRVCVRKKIICFLSQRNKKVSLSFLEVGDPGEGVVA